MNKFIFFIAISWGLFIQFGPLGYGVDVHHSYLNSSNWPLRTEPLGWIIASLNVEIFGFDYFIGSSVTSFVLAVGLFLFLFELLKKFSTTGVIILGLLLLFSHPIILGGTNILRQGLALGFFLLFLFNFLRNNNIYAIFFTLASILSHNSILIILVPFYIKMLPLSKNIKKLLIFFYCLSLIIATEYIVSFKSSIGVNAPYEYIVLLMFFYYLIALKTPIFKRRLMLFSKKESMLLNVLFIEIIIAMIFIGYPSVLQRLLIYIFIPIVVFAILWLPLGISERYIIMFIISFIWLIVVLSSNALSTWSIIE